MRNNPAVVSAAYCIVRISFKQFLRYVFNFLSYI
jgi:hypothetical protein